MHSQQMTPFTRCTTKYIYLVAKLCGDTPSILAGLFPKFKKNRCPILVNLGWFRPTRSLPSRTTVGKIRRNRPNFFRPRAFPGAPAGSERMRLKTPTPILFRKFRGGKVAAPSPGMLQVLCYRNMPYNSKSTLGEEN
jgi:hypothetical protein